MSHSQASSALLHRITSRSCWFGKLAGTDETHLPSLKLCFSLVRSYIRSDTSGINSSLGWTLCQAQAKFLHSPTQKKLLTVAEKLEASNVGIEKLEKEVLGETSLAVGISTLRFVQDHLKLFPPWSCPGIKCSPYLLAILSNGKAGHSTGQFFIREVASSSHLLGTLLAWLQHHPRLGQHRVDLYFNVFTACSSGTKKTRELDCTSNLY